MAKKNRTQYAILGLLSIRPSSGYDLKQTCDRVLRHFWTEGYGSIYPILKRLEVGGYARSWVEAQEGRPDRRVYEITEAGREVLNLWLSEPIEPPRIRNEMLLKLFLGPQGALSDLEANVRLYREQHEQKLAEYRALEEEVRTVHADSQFNRYWLLSLDYGIRMCQAYVDWCDATEEELKKETSR